MLNPIFTQPVPAGVRAKLVLKPVTRLKSLIMSSRTPLRLPLSKLQLAEQQRRVEEATAEAAATEEIARLADAVSTPSAERLRDQGAHPHGPPDSRSVVSQLKPVLRAGRPRASSDPTASSPPSSRMSTSPEQHIPFLDHHYAEPPPTQDPPAHQHQPAQAEEPKSPPASFSPPSVGSPDSAAAHKAVTRGRTSSVDRILAELNYPRTVVKVVAEYNPTTRDQLLCELKKEEARTRWALTPMGKRRPVEALKQQLREIDEKYVTGCKGEIDGGMVEIDDVDQLANKRRMRKRIDNANRKRQEGGEEMQLRSEGRAEERLRRVGAEWKEKGRERES